MSESGMCLLAAFQETLLLTVAVAAHVFLHSLYVCDSAQQTKA